MEASMMTGFLYLRFIYAKNSPFLNALSVGI